MTDPPCRRCTPPRRYPGCQCDAKRQWDEQRAAARSVQRGEGTITAIPRTGSMAQRRNHDARHSAFYRVGLQGLPATFLPLGTGDQPPASGRGSEPSL